MIVENESSFVFFANQPSCAKPTPDPKATRKSSLPGVDPTPTENGEKEVKDDEQRLANVPPLSSENQSSLLARLPIMRPGAMPAAHC